MKLLFTVPNGVEVYGSDDMSSGSLMGPANIDGDGRGPSHGDPYYQNDTSLHDSDGLALNSDEVPYVVFPPQVILAFPGIVLGCKVRVVNQLNGRSVDAVVGDIGPHSKIGEISIACAKALLINWSPINGGEERHCISYCFWPGVPAVVNGKTYPLQPYRRPIS